VIKVDASDASVLAYCTTTGCHWRALRGSRAEAYAVGNYHQRTVHADEKRATKTADELARRHRHAAP
jgi:transposase